MIIDYHTDFMPNLINSDSRSRQILITIEEFTRILSKHFFSKQMQLAIQPVLQVWGRLNDGRYKISGFFSVSGIPSYSFIVVGYDFESVNQPDLHYEKDKFYEMLQEELLPEIVNNNIADSVTILDVVIQKSNV